ncbi:MAG: UvrD-helicase domain-containing protein [Phycisphaera sp.]|nr:MAG: UvrD-helicase domain-containing protein [Phycisphaera sp.]
MIRLPAFSNDEIDRVVEALGLQCDEERRAILAHRDTADIRACAGSGKTTLLVTKLALLTDAWADRYRGIAILSHTNVAHREIRKRFSHVPGLRALEGYPHFLGTIQAFVDVYLGIPGVIANFGIRPVVIDDERFGTAAMRAIGHQSYATATGWLKRQHNGEALVRGLHFALDESDQVVLASAGGSLPSIASATGKALVQLKAQLLKQGLFRFDDMNAMGLWYARHRKRAADAVARRFPVVFIDETQDTDPEQASLLDLIFHRRSVVQRFGDDRQAIYRGVSQSEPGAGFPRAGHLSMTSSRRASPSIAKLSENVCNGTVEAMQGNASNPDRCHTVFVFSLDRVTEVIPAFARHAAAEIGHELNANEIKAIGFRRDGASVENKIPGILADYCGPHVTIGQGSSRSLSMLSEYDHAARSEVIAERGTGAGSNQLLNAACHILELQGVRLDGQVYTPRRLLRRLRELDHAHSPKLSRVLAHRLGRDLEAGDGGLGAFSTDLLESLKPLCDDDWNAQVIAFCAVPEDTVISDGGLAPPARPASDGVEVATDIGTMEVGIGTIHSVKGETLEAVLVLTTYFHDHDLKQLIAAGFLSGLRPTAAKARQKRLQENVKRIHVAMTRARQLVCLAIRDDHLSADQRAAMERMGWTFKSVD